MIRKLKVTPEQVNNIFQTFLTKDAQRTENLRRTNRINDLMRHRGYTYGQALRAVDRERRNATRPIADNGRERLRQR